MKKYSYVGISLVILVFGIWVVSEYLARNSKESLSYIEIEGERKKVPEFDFRNQNNKTITNKDYLGKVYVVEFFFATCPTICPIMNENLLEVQDQFYGNMNFGIASFTINPEHDTPEVLKKHAEELGVKHPHWNFLTGDKDKIYELANKGFNIYAREDEKAEGGFEHSGFFALIDQEGYIRSRKDEAGNSIIFYQGSVPIDNNSGEGHETQQIDILMEDIQILLK
ncbi:copper metallochaperone, cytochrome oxidase biogenesis protein, SCO family [Psychroflexus torquis ATCC 700755]|uniref:Copper metallochaperone, cytochrome oxidase biogenesis protein, SCO family n=1 Tax=Psychroflexus torquis (strain ATCC 700755 / CIP 106069 / ACAM 623) TaxID=313595 RepID=K4IGU1_PSYTT|nr:SCO family protein [Psychroflexus torquis]AFU68978.1 copper metallochaperone, cytochrome oxidase biogenesis protein, SCO family [Psychroflexus torquis ATCC 700755]